MTRLLEDPLVNGGAFCKLSVVCQFCGKPFTKYSKTYNLAEEDIDITVPHKKCKYCKFRTNIRIKTFTGADGEKYLGVGSPDSEIMTASGMLTKSGIWSVDVFKRLIKLGVRISKLEKGKYPDLIIHKKETP